MPTGPIIPSAPANGTHFPEKTQTTNVLKSAGTIYTHTAFETVSLQFLNLRCVVKKWNDMEEKRIELYVFFI